MFSEVVKHLLLQKNEDEAVNVTNNIGKTLLHIAAATNNLPLCKLLLNQNCKKNAVMKHAVSSLFDSVLKCCRIKYSETRTCQMTNIENAIVEYILVTIVTIISICYGYWQGFQHIQYFINFVILLILWE